jgi:plastocyanin
MMRSYRWALAAAVLALLTMLACSQSQGGGRPAQAVSTVPRPGQETASQPSAASPVAVSDAAGQPLVVTYRGGAFEPKRLDIQAGQTVRFVNGSDREFWVASNIHPTHQIYPSFDAKNPIPPGGSWEFTFGRPGYWRYHNHLMPNENGLVVVAGEETVQASPLRTLTEAPTFQPLGPVSPQDIINLFQNDALLAQYVETYGPAATIALLAENEARLSGDCHQRAHIVGRVAYERFGALAFSLAGHECHSGGYHGATEALFRERGTVNLEAVCGNELNSFFRHQCVHGVGHGLMAWTSYELFDGLELCDKLSASTDQLSCYSGVFMENLVGGLSGSMGHVTEYLSNDPHYPCNILSERYMPHCYYYQTSRMVQLFSGDFQKVAQGCAESPESAHVLCYQSMGRDVGGMTRGRPAEAIEDCGYVQAGPYRLDCLEGAVQDSFWDKGGADDALAFCGLLSESQEAGRCYNTIIARAHQIYDSPEGLGGFCLMVPEAYRRGCP